MKKIAIFLALILLSFNAFSADAKNNKQVGSFAAADAPNLQVCSRLGNGV